MVRKWLRELIEVEGGSSQEGSNGVDRDRGGSWGVKGGLRAIEGGHGGSRRVVGVEGGLRGIEGGQW